MRNMAEGCKVDTEEFIVMKVQHPRTHIKKQKWAQYTDYEIFISTNSIIFTLPTSKVRRRYSEFQWLRRKLLEHNAMLRTPPSLPPKKLVGKFKKDFIKSRCIGLQDFLANVTAVASYLSSVALHMFLQTNLSVKEIECVLDGKDQRDVTDIILKGGGRCELTEGSGAQCGVTSGCRPRQSVAESGYITNSRSSSQLSTVLSGASSTTCSISEVSCSVNQGHGNGWSSGFTCLNKRTQHDPCKGPMGPCRQGPVLAHRRTTLRNDAASVLPTGEILVPEFKTQAKTEPSLSALSLKTNTDFDFFAQGETFCNYDADDETELEISDYDLIKTQKLLKIRRWLNSFSAEGYCMCDSSSSEEDFRRPAVIARHLKTYDVLSTGSLMFNDSLPSPQFSVYPDCDISDNGSDQTHDSEFSIVHSSIDSLDLTAKETPCSFSSEGSLDSVEIYRTYDVVEMVEIN